MAIVETDRHLSWGHGEMNVTLDKASLAVQVNSADAAWKTVPGAASVAIGTEAAERKEIQLRAAGEKRFEPYVSGYFEGVKIRLGQFPRPADAGGLQVSAAVLLNTHSSEIVFELHEADGGTELVSEAVWPGAFSFSSDRGTDYTVVPAMQGYMIPADWREPVVRYHQGMMFGRDAYMPWWGQVKDGNGYLAIIDTPDDARLAIEHIPSVQTHAEVVWMHSLGRFDRPRKLQVRFRPNMDHVAMAKMYRGYVHSLGRLRTLTEKQAANPKLSRLIGSAVVHTGVHTRIAPVSDYYDKTDPAKNDYAIPFEERASQLAELQRRYGDKLYVHVDGWGLRGYDNLHPDVLPPSPKGGGWNGMAKLQQTCRDEGILLAIHDNYRDFYYDAASYDTALTVKDREGKQEYCDIWAGGAHSFLCTSFSKGYVERNYDTLKDNGIEPDGVYIDVFAVVPGDECYDPAHRMTRTECLAYRAACFYEIRSRGMIVSSEEPADWAVPHLDLVHHAPHALFPGPGEGPAIGVPIPLFSLVYHDAIVVPWSTERGAWGIPKPDLGYLHGLLNAGVPYLPIRPTEEEMAIARTLATLHGRVGCLEMTGHEFVGGNRRVHRSTFADGTTVEVDFERDAFAIRTADGVTVTEQALQGANG